MKITFTTLKSPSSSLQTKETKDLPSELLDGLPSLKMGH